jgi:hypothetical protein
MSKTFDTLDVVTVSTGVLVSDRGIGSVYEVLNYLLDDDLMTHQLPAASRAVEPSLPTAAPVDRRPQPAPGRSRTPCEAGALPS